MSEKYDWRYEKSINTKDKYLDVNEIGQEKYNPFRTNSSLSNFIDTVQHANFVNQNRHLDAKLQYDYLFAAVRKKKRFFENRGAKKKTEEDFKLVQDYYQLNNERTREALAILTEEQLAIIRKKLYKGGIK